MSKRSTRAQSAYSSRDTELSRAVHQSTELADIASGKSDFLHGVPPSYPFTSSPLSAYLTGSIASILLSSCVGHVGKDIIVTVWFTGVVASTALAFLWSWVDMRFKQDFGEFERSRERWEVDNFPEGEVQEMVQIYSGYGMSDDDALAVARTLSKYPEFWIDHMLLHEIGIVPSSIRQDDEFELTTTGFATLAFLSAFIVPTGIFVSGGSALVAWMLGLGQLAAIIYAKTLQCQWLSVSTSSSVGIVVFLCSAAIHVSLGFLLSLL